MNKYISMTNEQKQKENSIPIPKRYLDRYEQLDVQVDGLEDYKDFKCKCCSKTILMPVDTVQLYILDEHYKRNHMAPVTDSLYLGCFSIASNKHELDYFKITDIINTARELKNVFPKDYNYYNLQLDDTIYQNLFLHLDTISDYINMLIINGCKVYVHCFAGVSRSTSIIIAYLIKYKHMTYDDALNHISKLRFVKPNSRFAQDLKIFSDKYEKLREDSSIKIN
jgi:protein-tyrosine phosphatase